MSDQDHYSCLLLAIVSGNSRDWNFWRIDHPAVLPSLMAIELSEISLPYINLSRADLSYSNFSGTNLFHANLQKADLTGANLSGTNLRNADLTGAILRHANLTNADLQRASLTGADLSGARLGDANLTGARLKDIKLGKGSITAEAQRGASVSLLEKAALRLSKPRIRGKFKPFPSSGVPVDSDERR